MQGNSKVIFWKKRQGKSMLVFWKKRRYIKDRLYISLIHNLLVRAMAPGLAPNYQLPFMIVPSCFMFIDGFCVKILSFTQFSVSDSVCSLDSVLVSVLWFSFHISSHVSIFNSRVFGPNCSHRVSIYCFHNIWKKFARQRRNPAKVGDTRFRLNFV